MKRVSSSNAFSCLQTKHNHQIISTCLNNHPHHVYYSVSNNSPRKEFFSSETRKNGGYPLKNYNIEGDFHKSYSMTDLNCREGLKNHYQQQKRGSRILPPFGNRLIDYVNLEESDSDLRIHTSNPKAPTFDLYNSKYVPNAMRPKIKSSVSTKISKQKPEKYDSLHLHHLSASFSIPKKDTKPTRLTPIIVDDLEKIAILTLRMSHLHDKKCTMEDVRELVKKLLCSTSESDVDTEILELCDLEKNSNDDFVENDPESEEIIKNLTEIPILIPKSENIYKRSRIFKILENRGFKKEDVTRWIQCIKAPTIISAVQAMEEGPNSHHAWPKFLLLYTLRRHCFSRLEVMELMRLYVLYFPTLDKTTQSKFLFRMIQRSQHWLPDILPNICQIFVKSGKHDLVNDFVCNQILWSLSGFGRIFSSASLPANSNDSQSSLLEKQPLQNLSRENEFYLQAQHIILDAMMQHNVLLDTKGYLALANCLLRISPERTRAFLDIIRAHDYPVSLSEKASFTDNLQGPIDGHRVRLHRAGVFPYIQGLPCLEILLSRTGEEALNAFDRAMKNTYWASVTSSMSNNLQYNPDKSSIIWAILIRQLRHLDELTPEITENLWNRIKENNVNVTPYLLSQVVMGLITLRVNASLCSDRVAGYEKSNYGLDHINSHRSNLTISNLELVKEILMNQYPGLMNASLASSYIRLVLRVDKENDEFTSCQDNLPNHRDNLSMVRELLSNMTEIPSISCYNALLASELRKSPGSMWSTYNALLDSGYEPDNLTLYYMCRAAWDIRIKWTDYHSPSHGNTDNTLSLYATQRMVVEFKHWVRGSHVDGGDSNDLLKLYPSQRLVFAYTVMLGRAGYHDDLLEILPWLDRINMIPNKQILCALITYSPNGKYLMNHGISVNSSTFQSSEGKSTEKINWPTFAEVEVFQRSQKRLYGS